MFAFLMVLHVFICFLLVISVLLQAGRGGGLSGSFGAGGGQAIFGGCGAGTFFSKATVVLGALFFVSSLGLAMMATQGGTQRKSLVQEAAKRSAPEEAPARAAGAQNRPTPAHAQRAPADGAASGAPATPSGKQTPPATNPQGK